eukprot:TRINITY_DN1363_c0_g1_i1.p1 TRINITY_DN1363_c0_g1~~TRINITY_DN1363_c0_g1_i1.p1  ORF type:complete len:535 (+),score=139.03 TRINITY_DN1363_c0_g1_i1:37-1641(+)
MKRSNVDDLQEESRKRRRVDADDDPLDLDPFGSLPHEILDLVFQNCPQEDDTKWLTVFGSVCNRWRKMTKHYVHQIEIKKPSAYILSEVVPSLPNVFAMRLKKPVPQDLTSLTNIKNLVTLDFKCPRKMTDQLAQEMTHSFELIGQLTQLVELTLNGPITDEHILRLTSLVNLQHLGLSEADAFTEQSVRVLQHFTDLYSLDMPWDWTVCPSLAKLTNLRHLYARSGEGRNTLEDLGGLVNLIHVELGETEPAHLGHIAAWTNLESLRINALRVNDSITQWTALQKLKHLELSYSEITPQLLRTVIRCTNLRSIYFDEGVWLDWDFVPEDLLANISRLTKLKSLSDLKHHPVFDIPISHLPESLTDLEIISDNGQMREQFFANIHHLTNLKRLKFSYTQGGKHALTSAIIEGLACLTALEELHIGNDRYNDEFYPIYREMVRMTGPHAAVFLEQYANHTSSFPHVSFAAFSSLTNLRDLKVDLDPFFEDQLLALTTLTNLKSVKFGKYFFTSDLHLLWNRATEAHNSEFVMEDD